MCEIHSVLLQFDSYKYSFLNCFCFVIYGGAANSNFEQQPLLKLFDGSLITKWAGRS